MTTEIYAHRYLIVIWNKLHFYINSRMGINNVKIITGSYRNRIQWVDVSRGIAFLMVIYSHLPMCNSRVMIFFSPIFLTTFFFISGYLYKSGSSFFSILKHRSRTLLLPFFTLGFIMIMVSQIFSFHEHVRLKDALLGLIYQNGENQILWFVAALYVYSLFFYFIDRFCKTWYSMLMVAIAMYILDAWLMFHTNLPAIPWHINALGCAIFYMSLGSLYRSYEDKIDNFLSFPIVYMSLIFYTLYIAISGIYIGHYGSYYILDGMTITTMGIIIIVKISKRFNQINSLIIFVGANTLIYFAFHGKIYALILAVGNKILPHLFNSTNPVILFFVALGTVFIDAVILIIPTLVINRYFPWLLGNFKKHK